jgi:hypothetical protein
MSMPQFFDAEKKGNNWVKFFVPPKVDWVSLISSLRAKGPMGRWPEIDEDKKIS